MAQWEFKLLMNDNSSLTKGRLFSYLPNRVWTQRSNKYSAFFTYTTSSLQPQRCSRFVKDNDRERQDVERRKVRHSLLSMNLVKWEGEREQGGTKEDVSGWQYRSKWAQHWNKSHFGGVKVSNVTAEKERYFCGSIWNSSTSLLDLGSYDICYCKMHQSQFWLKAFLIHFFFCFIADSTSLKEFKMKNCYPSKEAADKLNNKGAFSINIQLDLHNIYRHVQKLVPLSFDSMFFV